MKIIKFLIICGFSSVINAQTFTVSPGSAITSANPTTTANIVVAGVGTIDCSFGLDVVCLDITHTFDSDLDIFLMDPSGATYELVTDVGGGGNNYQVTCFDLSAGSNITSGTAPFNGTFTPEPASSFQNANNGQTANGTWQIQITDDAGGDVGTLNSFSITFAANPECTMASGLANDDCSGAIALSINAACVNTVGTNVTATASVGVPAPGCANYSGGDVWFSVVVPASGNITTTVSDAGGFTDGGMALYTGTCGALTLVECDDDDGPGLFPEIISTGLTPGSTVFYRVWEYGNDLTGNFNICATDVPPVGTPPNDLCSGAISLNVNASCSNTTGNNTGATDSGETAPGCANYSGGDLWYSIVVPANGSVTVTTSSASGFTDSGMAIYSGACGALTLITCNDDGGSGTYSEIIENGLTPGSTIFVRIWEYGNNSFGDINICAVETVPPNICGEGGSTVGTNDFCSTPASLTIGGTSFSAATAASFTQDEPANVGTVFCGSIENNSWYQFIATATTHSFNVSSVLNCGAGIQGEVYDVTYDGNGCCNGFTSVSNCYNPGSTTAGTVTAVGLTIGNNYMLMIDGNGGANCDFTIDGWTGVNILPVSLIRYTGINNLFNNELNWTTASEINNDYFIIEKSTNNINYTEVGKIHGNANSANQNNYSFLDYNINSPVTYYNLIQVDFDGTKKQLGTIKILKSIHKISAYPNPSNTSMTFTFSSNYNNLTIEFIDINGRIFKENTNAIYNKTFKSNLFETLSSGIYSVRFINSEDIIETIKISKF